MSRSELRKSLKALNAELFDALRERIASGTATVADLDNAVELLRVNGVYRGGKRDPFKEAVAAG